LHVVFGLQSLDGQPAALVLQPQKRPPPSGRVMQLAPGMHVPVQSRHLPPPSPHAALAVPATQVAGVTVSSQQPS
jgi:hypothetical protein